MGYFALFPLPLARTEDDVEIIRSFVSKINFFQQIEDQMQTDLVRHARYHHAKPGEVVVKQGDAGFTFYAILSGTVDVYIKEDEEEDEVDDDEGSNALGDHRKGDGQEGIGHDEGQLEDRDGASDGGHQDDDKASVEDDDGSNDDDDDDKGQEDDGKKQSKAEGKDIHMRRLSADQRRIEQQYSMIRQQSRKKTFRQWSKTSVLSTRMLCVPHFDDADGAEGDALGGAGGTGPRGSGVEGGAGGTTAANGDGQENRRNSAGSVEEEEDDAESVEILYGNRVCSLSAGDSFGEKALTGDDATRNATIVTPDGADFIVFEKEVYARVLQKQGRKLLFNVNTCREALMKVPRARTKDDIGHLFRLAGTIPFFQQVPARQRRKLCKVMKLLIFDANESEFVRDVRSTGGRLSLALATNLILFFNIGPRCSDRSCRAPRRCWQRFFCDAARINVCSRKQESEWAKTI